MMEAISITTALVLPWLLGAVWVRPAVAGARPGRWALMLGYGYLLGSIGFTVLMRAVDALGLPLSFANLALAGAAAVLLGLFVNLRAGPGAAIRGGQAGPALGDLPAWQKVLFVGLLALIAVRLGGLALEVLWRPLFPWDASMHWATKAKVWLEAGEIAPFVDYDRWLESTERVYTDRHPGYPVTVPLLQLWVNTALGRWDDSLMNLPWVLCAAALGLAFFGQARLAGGGPLLALVFVYFLLSMPMLNTQVALAGYADPFIGACYGAAVMAFYQWTRAGDRGQGILALAMTLSCPLIKNEGLFWAATLALGWLAVVLPPRRLAVAALVGVLLAPLALLLVPDDLRIAGNTLEGLGGLRFRAEAMLPILKSLFVLDSWHLLWYLIAALIPLGLAVLRPWRGSYLGIGVALGTAFALFLTLFIFTAYAGTTAGFTSVSRINLHLAPAFVFLAALLARDLAVRFPGTTFAPGAADRG
jgi:hypothetical protein